MATDDAQPLPRTWGRYTLTEVLGRGGMGAVYGALLSGRGGFEKEVALKVLHPGHAGTQLLEEARLGGYLRHPYVVETYDVGTHEDQVFFAMEWVRGPTLHDVLKGRSERLPLGTAFDIVQQLCMGLDYAHGLSLRGEPLGLVHLDIKPQNVLLDPIGMTKITDFGIARAAGFRTHDTDAGGAVGTRGYMAPEVVQDLDGIDARADVFAVSTLLAELVLGRRLWPRKGGWIAYGRAVIRAAEWLDRQGVPAELDEVVDGLGGLIRSGLDPDPAQRTESLLALQQGLDALHPGGGSIAELVAEHQGARPRPAVRPPSSTTGSALRRTNLRREDPLVGREADLQRLEDAVRRPGLVTLLGPGGVGKTRLSKAVGRSVLGDMDGGSWFVDLAGSRSADEALEVLREVLDLPGAGSTLEARFQAAAEGLARLGRILVILDNVEQVVDELGPLLEPWLGSAPEATLLCTSQRRLGTRGEQVVPLGTLSVEHGATLFVERASVADLDPTDPWIRKVVERLDGLPLAVELAAARARFLSPKQLFGALQDRFQLLVDRTGGRPDRHQTLERAVAWSWELLARWQQAALAQLSVFRGPFGLTEAQAVLDLEPWPEAPWPLFVLEDLVDRSLLVVVPGREPRFRMLLGVRDFAEGRLARPGAVLTALGGVGSGPEAQRAAEARHGLLFAEFGSGESVLERHGPNAVEAMGRLLDAAPDLRHALDLAVERNDAEVAYRATRAWCDVQRAVGHPAVIRPVLERVLSCSLEPLARIALLLQHAMASMQLSDIEAHDAATRQGMALATELGDHKWIGIFHHCLGSSAVFRGDRELAERHYEAGLQASLRAGDLVNEMVFRSNLANHEAHMGRFRSAIEHHRRNIALGRERGQVRIVADNQLYLAGQLYMLGQSDAAWEAVQACAPVHEELGMNAHRMEGEILEGRILSERGDVAGAARCFRDAWERARQHQGASEQSQALAEQALWLVELDAERALRSARKAVALVESVDVEPGLAGLALGRALLENGQVDTAREVIYAALQVLRGKPFQWRLAARLTHGRIAAAQGDLETARADLEVCRVHLDASGIGPEAPLGREAAKLARAVGEPG